MYTKVLVLDNEAAACRLFAEMLEQYGYQAITETDGRKVMDRLRAERVDVVLLGVLMPTINTLGLLWQIKQHWEGVPVVIVTGQGGIEAAVASMQAGAADFVTKPVVASVLDIRLKKAIEYVHTKRLANLDGLTGLYNYRAFRESLRQAVAQANRSHHPLSLIMSDIDHFKRYNDTYGHLQGDDILRAVAGSLQQLSRASDVIARYGGEEFALILPETDRADAEALGHRLREHIERHQFPGEKQLPGQTLTISLGVASHTPPHTEHALLEAADKALYQAKRQGRNRVCVWQQHELTVPN